MSLPVRRLRLRSITPSSSSSLSRCLRKIPVTTLDAEGARDLRGGPDLAGLLLDEGNDLVARGQIGTIAALRVRGGLRLAAAGW